MPELASPQQQTLAPPPERPTDWRLQFSLADLLVAVVWLSIVISSFQRLNLILALMVLLAPFPWYGWKRWFDRGGRDVFWDAIIETVIVTVLCGLLAPAMLHSRSGSGRKLAVDVVGLVIDQETGLGIPQAVIQLPVGPVQSNATGRWQSQITGRIFGEESPVWFRDQRISVSAPGYEPRQFDLTSRTGLYRDAKHPTPPLIVFGLKRLSAPE